MENQNQTYSLELCPSQLKQVSSVLFIICSSYAAQDQPPASTSSRFEKPHFPWALKSNVHVVSSLRLTNVSYISTFLEDVDSPRLTDGNYNSALLEDLDSPRQQEDAITFYESPMGVIGFLESSSLQPHEDFQGGLWPEYHQAWGLSE